MANQTIAELDQILGSQLDRSSAVTNFAFVVEYQS